MNMDIYTHCELCPRRCGVDRTAGQTGVCGMTDRVTVARASLHMWEEPPISGTRGSGTIFFSGCPMLCDYCQNRDISRGSIGRELSVEQLAQLFLTVRDQGAHNLNLVTATHFAPSVKVALDIAQSRGFDIPVVFNTSGYESISGIDSMDGTVDIYLADLRYFHSDTAARYSHAPDYPEVARAALCRMVEQVGEPVIGSDGLMQRGVIVRILLLPGHLIEAKQILKYIYTTYSDRIYISLMSQFTPRQDAEQPLDRTVTEAEYHSLLSYAESLGVTRAFTQDLAAATDSFIPPFNQGGLLDKIK